ncbi:putative Nucleotide-sugar transporter VRG4/SQV-7 [Paratrimastix pyriformis]|uniref:Nucleotide-sugar transporter VRG4/SQV-7 n=1 Tax=Paratrimastix pyriformis TaxID=342808 RepID=A0ABQ8UMC5_9EUKA|nr:putative Nucleotide-sugar transporter VRG4/SQV-7 [Paratrimastix pyriformis]
MEYKKRMAAPIWWDKFISCTCYCACSASMVLVNKSIDNIFGFRSVFALIFWQNLVTWLGILIARLLGWVSFPLINFDFVVKWIPVELVFSTMLVSSILSLKYLTTNIIVIFKNLTNILTAICDWYFFGNKPNFYTVISLSMMVLSSAIAGFSDLYFHKMGYFWMFVNCIATAANTILLKRLQNQLKASKLEQGRFGTPFWNNILSMPPLFSLMVAWGELSLITDTLLKERRTLFWVVMLFSGFLGTFQSVCSLWCLRATSATTYAMVGALNKIPTSIIGLLLFHTKVTPMGYFSIAMGIASGFLYSWANAPKPKPTSALVAPIVPSVSPAPPAPSPPANDDPRDVFTPSVSLNMDAITPRQQFGDRAAPRLGVMGV